VFFMYLYIRSEFYFAVFVIVMSLSCHNSSRTYCCVDNCLAKIHSYTISTISLGGYLSNGGVVAIAHILSLTILMYLSISGMSSSSAHMFTVMPCLQLIVIYV